VLYSFNIRDYSVLHEQWIASGREHSGIILASQQRYSIGEQLRRGVSATKHYRGILF
jgi:hypothetical protein